MRRLGIVIVLAAVFTATAAATAGSPRWSARGMIIAMRGLGYPTPHALKLSCKGLGTGTEGRYAYFLCKATYRHSAPRRFVAAGHSVGGWVCAEKPGAGYCIPLRHGFVVMTHTKAANELKARAVLAASGYVENHYGIANASPSGPCVQKASDGTKWTCPYLSNRGPVMEITISLKAARGGYITTGTTAPR
jgi:hypothetical protein